jgi:hypothetical protein
MNSLLSLIVALFTLQAIRFRRAGIARDILLLLLLLFRANGAKDFYYLTASIQNRIEASDE